MLSNLTSCKDNDFIEVSYLCRMKHLLTVIGVIALGLGILGIFLPVLPTTPFLLAASAVFLKSSPRLYNWLMSHPRLGPYIRDFQLNKAIPMRVKVISVSLVWLTLLNCAIFVAGNLLMRLLFISIAVAVTAHILHYKTSH